MIDWPGPWLYMVDVLAWHHHSSLKEEFMFGSV